MKPFHPMKPILLPLVGREMPGWLVGCVLLLTLLASPVVAQESRLAVLEEQAIKQAAAGAAPSLVRIETVGGMDRVGEQLTGTGPTTGVVLSADGYIISSSFNFASKPASIVVTLPDGRRLAATQVATDRLKMLTLLKVEAKDLVVPRPAAAATFQVGQTAIALGKTYDEQIPTLSVGIISALHRIWGKAIQTDAKVSPVNYGGALVNLEGEFLGVIVPLSPQATGELAGVEWYDGGIGFAIPLVDILATLERFKKGKDLSPGLLGVYLKGADIYEGVPAIDRLRFGSPAQAAGFKVGDVITAVDGKPVVRHAQVLHILGNKYAGDQVQLQAQRGKETVSATVTLVDKLDPYEPPFLGILPVREASAVPPPAAAAGVAVRYVYPKSPAALAGLKEGDRILRIENTEVNNRAALQDQVSRHRPQDKLHLTIAGSAGPREVEVALGSLPESIPADVRSVAIPAGEKQVAGKGPKTGRISERIVSHEHDYWAYVPDDYNPRHKYGLVVWIHPPGDTFEAALLPVWKPLCAERGLIFLAPKAKLIAGWNPTELEFIKDLTDQFVQTYNIDTSRVIVHSFAQSGTLAYLLAFKQRQLFQGICTAGAPLLVAPPENEPEHRLQFLLLSGEKDPLHQGITKQVEGLRKLKYPVSHLVIPGGDAKYPSAEYLRDVARWIDALDRI